MTANFFMVQRYSEDEVPTQDLEVVPDDGQPIGAPSALHMLRKPWPGNVQPPTSVAEAIPPSGVYKGLYRVFRDPNIVTDDSADDSMLQVYNHGWLICESLVTYLYERDLLTWPLPFPMGVHLVTGTPTIQDGKGWYGIPTGSLAAVASTSLFPLVGDGVAGKQVSLILTRLQAASTANRNAIIDASKQSAQGPAIQRAQIVGGAAPVTGRMDDFVPNLTQRRLAGRFHLLSYLARYGMWSSSAGRSTPPNADGNAVLGGLYAVLLKEHNLVLDNATPNTRLTTADYNTLTAPLRAGITMPSGY